MRFARSLHCRRVEIPVAALSQSERCLLGNRHADPGAAEGKCAADAYRQIRLHNVAARLHLAGAYSSARRRTWGNRRRRKIDLVQTNITSGRTRIQRGCIPARTCRQRIRQIVELYVER